MGNTASGMDNRGGVSRSRSFDFSLFASELFNRVSVQKSYSADQDEGGIAGTVGLYTAKPFDYSGAKFVVSAKGQTNTNTSGVTPRVVALASDRWGDFGALVSVAYSEIKNNEYGYRNWGWGKVTYNAANIGPNIDPQTAALLRSGTIYAPQAESPSTWYTDRKRLGVTSALQYHGDTLKLDLDLLYGRLWDHRDDWAIAVGRFQRADRHADRRHAGDPVRHHRGQHAGGGDLHRHRSALRASHRRESHRFLSGRAQRQLAGDRPAEVHRARWL